VPYGEPSAFQDFPSPYYKPSHFAYRKALREFYSPLRALAEEYEQSGEYPPIEMQKKFGQAGILASWLGKGEHLNYVTQLGGITPEEFDLFHEMISHEEMGRLGSPGFSDGIRAGYVIGASPIWSFGDDRLKQEVGVPVIRGEKRICLAISEAFAGSDVANLRTTARKSDDGRHYIVNGTKKWITNGVFADYFVTAVRTGGAGHGGVSMLMIPRSEGMETKQIKTSYASSAGTAYIIFEDVEVPVENLMGVENMGFLLVMHNFNHERWFIIAGFIASMRSVVEETMKWAKQRKVFGKPLLGKEVIRMKFAKMISALEGVYSWLESITYQMQNMSHDEMNAKLGGQVALLKFYCTRVGHDISDDCVQIFGGRAITKTGMGRNIEAFQRTYKFASILGGSEEIMADLGVRQAMRNYPAEARL